MVGIGGLLSALAVFYLAVVLRKRRLPETAWFYRGLVLAGPLAVVALIAGWVTTEVGRQPWVVYRTMLTSQAVTGAGNGIPVGFATIAAVYAALAVGVGWTLVRLRRMPLGGPAGGPASAPGSEPA
jgi:cytochrome d ubiquinol oxidase subunit I